MTFRVLTQIDEETRARHAEADTQRLAIMTEPATPRLYRRFLLRLHGFESPVELALQSTPALADLIDLRARLHSRLLRSDLAALGIVDLTRVTRCAAVPRFRHVLEALGWMYVIERGRIVLDTALDQIGERYAQLIVRPERLAAARALKPFSERTLFGRTALFYEDVPREQLAPLGELGTPGVADLFVARMQEAA